MKTILALLLLVTSALAGPSVVIQDLTRCEVNGKPVGSVVDALANAGDGVRAPLLDALIAREAGITTQLADTKTAIDEKISVANAICKSKDADSVKLENLKVLLADVNRPEKEKAVAAAQAKVDAAQAELNALK